MDRKGIIAVALAIAVLVIWRMEFEPKFAPPAPPPGQAAAKGSPEASAAPAESVAAAVPPAPVTGGSTTAAVAPAEPAVPEQWTTVQGPQAEYHFTNKGGGIGWIDLRSYPGASGTDVELNRQGTEPIGGLSEEPGQAQAYQVTTQGTAVVCTRTAPDGLEITKRFTVADTRDAAHGYQVKLEVTFANKGAKPVARDGFYLYLGAAAPVQKNEMPIYVALDLSAQGQVEKHIDTLWFNAKKIPFVGVETAPERSLYTADAAGIQWAGVSNQYFTMVASLPGGQEGTGAWARRFEVPGGTPTRPLYGLESAVKTPGVNLGPGQTASRTYEFYAGPKFYTALKSLGGGQERIISYYFSFWGMSVFRPVSVFLLNSMNLLHHWTGSYAVAIILLTLFIRGALWPVQNKATASMRQMQALQPRMTELKEKYKDDPQKMNAEVMRLYKDYKVNPVAGCLPMFVQIPIFFGFYRVLGTAIELRGSHFLWVHDLSQPDTVFHVAGFPVNILPLCMAATMIWQMQLQPKTGDASQQRMMMFVPLIFIFVCYNFASALALYWTVQNVFTIAQLRVTRNRTAPEPVKLSPGKGGGKKRGR